MPGSAPEAVAHVRLARQGFEVLLEVAPDAPSVREAGRRSGAALVDEAVEVGTTGSAATGERRAMDWEEVARLASGTGLGTLVRESVAGSLWLVRADPDPTPRRAEFLAGLLEGLLAGLAGEPVSAVVLADPSGPPRLVLGAPALLDRIRSGLAAGRDPRALLEGS